MGKQPLVPSAASCPGVGPLAWPWPCPEGLPTLSGCTGPTLVRLPYDWVLRGRGTLSPGSAGARPLPLPCAPVVLVGQRQRGRAHVRAGGGHLSRVQLTLPRVSWGLGPFPESPGPGQLSAPTPLHAQGEPLCGLQATQPHRLPVPGPGPGVHSLTVHQVLSVGGRATCAWCAGVSGSPSACGSLGAHLCPRLPGH